MVPKFGPTFAWNQMPAIWSGLTGPLLQGFPAEIETPDIMRVGEGPLLTMRRWGFPVGVYPPELLDVVPEQWARGPNQPWGFGDQSTLLDESEKHGNPMQASERVQWYDVQRCVSVNASDLVTTGTAYGLVQFVTPTAGIGVIERIAAAFESVEALDAEGLPVFTFNTSHPCISSFRHPDPAVATPLTWSFQLMRLLDPAIERNNTGSGALTYRGPINPVLIDGTQAVPPWADLRYDADRFADNNQMLVPARTLTRLWVVLFGPPNRFRVTVSARLAGYNQLAGRRGAALEAAIRRYNR